MTSNVQYIYYCTYPRSDIHKYYWLLLAMFVPLGLITLTGKRKKEKDRFLYIGIVEKSKMELEILEILATPL